VRFADEDGEWDANKGQRLEGGRTCVEALLVRARSRWGVEKLMEDDWVKGGVNVQGGLQIEEDVEDS
jgi:protein-serine/threonine kinase